MAEQDQAADQASGAARTVAEWVSFGMLIGFLYLCWAPLALLGGFVVLFTWANFTKSGTARRVGAALGAAVAAARRAYAASKGSP